MPRKLGGLVVALIAILLQGYPPPGTTEFLNNTGDTVTVRWAREQVSVPAGGSVPVKSYEFPSTFEIAKSHGSWHYIAR
jgi:hypothetical protein